MIGIILFVAACLMWQGAKNKWRAWRLNQTIGHGRLRRLPGSPARLNCGCEVIMEEVPFATRARVLKPCAAHEIMMEVGR